MSHEPSGGHDARAVREILLGEDIADTRRRIRYLCVSFADDSANIMPLRCRCLRRRRRAR